MNQLTVGIHCFTNNISIITFYFKLSNIMKVDENGNVIVDNVQPLQNIGAYLHEDFDKVAQDVAEELSRGDDDDEMAYNLNY